MLVQATTNERKKFAWWNYLHIQEIAKYFTYHATKYQP